MEYIPRRWRPGRWMIPGRGRVEARRRRRESKPGRRGWYKIRLENGIDGPWLGRRGAGRRGITGTA